MKHIMGGLRRGRNLLIVAVTGLSLLSAGVADNYFEISKNLEIFTNLYRELNTYYVDETQPGDLMKAGIDAMLSSLDPYTIYYPESKIEDYRFMTTGQYGGIGALIQRIDEKTVISEPYEGYAAEQGGLRAGDEILEVDGKSVAGKNQEEISEVLKGQAGTEVSVKVKRPDVADPITVTLNRSEVKIPDVPYFGMLDDETGYIKLTGFTKTASSEVRTAFKDLKEKQGMKNLVLDLRGNGGGLLREAVNIVNFFVPKGTDVVSTKGKLEEWNRTHTALNDPLDLEIPLVVLVDGGSASASEIVSGTLQDLDRAVVIGETTFGKGLVQQTKDLSYNTKLKLTVAKYYTPSGRCIQKLDYSHKSEEGKAAAVPDSLIKPFYTKNGRPVFDGRGIKPDVEVELPNASNILNGLMLNHVIFHYATKFRAGKDSIPAAREFGLTDAEYSAFAAFASTQEFSYDTRTEALFKELEKIAAEERYKEGAEKEFKELFDKIQPHKEDDLIRFKSEISEFLESEIVARYYYQTGRIEYSLSRDSYVERALSVFDKDYNEILAGK